jgi:hypothetical protein
MIIKKLLLSTFILTGVLSAQSSVELNINNEDVEVLGSFNLNSTMGYTGGTSFLVDASYLYSDDSSLVAIGLSGENSLEAAQGLTFGFGAKLVFAEDYMALPLLARATFILPFDSDIPTTSLKASFAYAPSALTFLDGETYSELRAEADMEVISNIHVYAGYRNIDTDYITEKYKFNDSFYGGLKLNF